MKIEVAHVAADLRHMYRQLLQPGWTDKQVAEIARGLLGPAITQLETALANMSKKRT